MSRERLDDAVTRVDTISQGSEFLDIGSERKHVAGYLGDVLSALERARSPVQSSRA